jgi:hypothetical protein
MKEQTVELRGSTLGDAFGIGWFLRDVEGVRTVGHGGSANGQFAELLTVPERNFAVVAVSNAGPDGGIQFNQAVVRWALEHYLGVIDRDPEPLPYDEARAREIVGSYEIDVMTLTIGTDGAWLALDVRIKPEFRAAADTELPPGPPASGFRPAARRCGRVHRHQRRFKGAARLLLPRRTRRGRGSRPRWPVIQPGSDGLRVKPGTRSRSVGTSSIASGFSEPVGEWCGARPERVVRA